MLHGRNRELSAISALLNAVGSGRSAVLVVRGEPGIGKTALLDHTAAAAAGTLRVLRGQGVESEAELPYASLHLLLRSTMDRVDALPTAQADALRGALGLTPAAAPDRFLVGLAVLSLLSELAEERPLLVLVDDAQWLDHASAQALLFAARRLDADAVGLVFAARSDEDFPATGLPQLVLPGLDAPAAAAVLAEHATALRPADRYRVLTEAAGNPLALIELPNALNGAVEGPTAPASPAPASPAPVGPVPVPAPVSPAVAVSSIAATGTLPLTDRLREAFQTRTRRLPAPVQTLLVVAALDDSGDLGVVLRAAGSFGADLDDLDAAVRAGLIRLGDGSIAFHHPLVRAAVAQDAPLARRIAVHTALAAVLDRPADAGRRAWHLALAAVGPDDDVAAELERTATRAAERSAHAAAATYERAAALSADPAARLRRLTLAAEAAAEAGDLDRSEALAGQAVEVARATSTPSETAPRAAAGSGSVSTPDVMVDPTPDPTPDPAHDPALLARLAGVRAAASFWRGAGAVAHSQLMAGAELAATVDPGHAVSLLLEAVHVGWYTGERELAESVERLRATRLAPEEPLSALRELLVLAATPILGDRDTGQEGQSDSDGQTGGQTGGLAGEQADGQADGQDPDAVLAAARRASDDPGAALVVAGLGLILGQDAVTIELADEQARRTREQGRIGWLPQALFYLSAAQVFAGWHTEAKAAALEAVDLARATDQHRWVDQLGEPLAYLAALGGDEETCRRLTDAALSGVATHDPTWRVPWVYWALGLLDLGMGRAESALSRLGALARGRARFHIPATRSTPDLVEAAVRVGRPEEAVEAFGQYQRWAHHARQPWIDATVLRCRALLGPEADAGAHYAAALRGYADANRPFDQARTALLYGEWLRRDRRRAEARAHLQAALETFERLGATPWSARARTELAAAGSAAPAVPTGGVLAALTPQERQIIRLAGQGLSNKDIAAQLFLSPRTVGYHLYKAYPKLGIVSRGELATLDLTDTG